MLVRAFVPPLLFIHISLLGVAIVGLRTTEILHFVRWRARMSRAVARGGRVERLPQPITLDQFELGVTLGTGSFGRVRFVVHKVRPSLCRAVVLSFFS
jgi:hypothetical protein